jgi:hypothetical protein
MTHIKTNFLSFVKENNNDDIYKIINYLDNRKSEINEEFIKSGREVGPFLQYEIINDFTISVNYGFSDYEEGENNTSIITLTHDKITVNKNSDGYSVMVGDYDDEKNFVFNNITEFLQCCSEEI